MGTGCHNRINRVSRGVTGLEITAPREFNHLCSGCANDKSYRLPIPESSMSCYSKMELLVIDLTGPMSVPT